jgi:2-phospho-L-lactate transferase CofD
VFYLSNEGTHREHEVSLAANAQLCGALRAADAVVYGVGSLYTSIAPSLVLRGVGEAVAARQCPKVLLLNGCHDRETSLCLCHDGPMHAVRCRRCPSAAPLHGAHACPGHMRVRAGGLRARSGRGAQPRGRPRQLP